MRFNKRKQKGQAVMLVLVAMGIFMFGAMGLAIDTGTLYFHQRMAQAGADAAAIASIMSVFQGTNSVGATGHFDASVGTHACADQGAVAIPCSYGVGHNFALADVSYQALAATSPSWVSTEPGGSANEIKVTITRDVPNTLMRMVGAGATTKIKATATAAIWQVFAPIPILVLHPSKDGALSTNGNLSVIICGGPQQSIQINSTSASALSMVGGSKINLESAGPGATVTSGCGAPAHGSGGDLGIFGPVPDPGTSTYLRGTRPGQYVQPSSPIQDPLATVFPTAVRRNRLTLVRLLR